jgi:hypothetical protein
MVIIIIISIISIIISIIMLPNQAIASAPLYGVVTGDGSCSDACGMDTWSLYVCMMLFLHAFFHAALWLPHQEGLLAPVVLWLACPGNLW